MEAYGLVTWWDGTDGTILSNEGEYHYFDTRHIGDTRGKLREGDMVHFRYKPDAVYITKLTVIDPE